MKIDFKGDQIFVTDTHIITRL